MKDKKGFIEEFKTFILRGNVIDLAVGIIMGTAFTAIVKSLVDDVIMPGIGYIIGGVDFANFKILLSPAVGETPEVAIYYGKFINQTINFIIIAFVVFMMVRLINKLYKKKAEAPVEEAPPEPTKEELLLTEIRDLLKNK